MGGLGFFGPPDENGRVEFGYGLVPAVRGEGLASEAVVAALEFAAAHGARSAVADTDPANIASQRVLVKAGLRETRRTDSLIFYERELG
ncbi:GNAT family N-acetyltransferase [Microbacterium sp. XT11]|uniref:GNAT family N-acetyltransferase n=1 Tax=Microbacterium sp. XT11 TaxID=367477 RepID=UPI000A8C49AC|nr:GNAT family N-acetyltransferase [Microbacterium sp. XT11]